MTPSSGSRIVPTAEQLRALTHPIRLRLLGLLRADGPQTSAELARRTGLNTGATSYHLRMLASHGFIEDAPGLGTARERHWRAVHLLTSVPETPAAAPADASGSARPTLDERAAYIQAVVTQETRAMQSAAEEWQELPEQWRSATLFDDVLLRLSADQAREVADRLQETLRDLLDAYPPLPEGPAPRDAGDRAESATEPPGEVFLVQILAYPHPGRLPHRDPAGTP